MKAKAGRLFKITAVVIALIIVLAVGAAAYYSFQKPTLVFNASKSEGDVSSRASGYLYGIAQDGVPSYEMVKSLDISSVSAKTQGGLQHPIGEVGDVAGELISGGNCDYIVVYLQDMYSTWYYDHKNITELKAAGEYSWKEYIENEYFPLVEQTVNEIKASDYADRIVYCLYNECDNGIWFGSWVQDSENPDGGYSVFDDAGRQNFYNGWKMTYDFVKSLDENAVIGGPGNYEYNADKMDSFLSFTTANDCTPDVMIYHELGDRSIYDFQANANELREIEAKYGISKDTPIIVTEYGRMQDNGNPNTMLKYITCIEKAGVYGNQAYWLLANNLCSTCADYNSPNSAWWVYKWYADMNGSLMKSRIDDIRHSDFEKTLKGKREPRYQQFMGIGSVDDENKRIDILVAGAEYDGRVKITGIDKTFLKDKYVSVIVSAVTYQGISGKVYKPEIVKIYTTVADGKSLVVDMDNMNENTAYRIQLVETSDSDGTDYVNDNLYRRFEFEHGTLLGNAYTYDSAYATTGEINGMVGGMENEGDGIELEFDVPEDDTYELKFIYGNANDGAWDENGRQSSDDRTNSEVLLEVDGNEIGLSLENTIRSEFTSSYEMNYELSAGTHKMRITHVKGTIVLDSLLVRRASAQDDLEILKDNEGGMYVVSSSAGYYDVVFDEPSELTLGINSDYTVATNSDNIATVFLKQGLNYVKANNVIGYIIPSEYAGEEWWLGADAMKLSGTAKMVMSPTLYTPYVTGISSNGGSAEVTVTVENSGSYALTLLYANNHEQGVHDYNIDLVEDPVAISVNGTLQKRIYCRNTYSWDNYATVTTNVELKKGSNTIVLYNDGSNLFNGSESFAPNISAVIINEYSVKY